MYTIINITGKHKVHLILFVSGGADAAAQIKTVEVQHMKKLQ
ncbi:hypothetical protein [Clostridium lacusfryxellense]|nr:hypothetical protein [Clostridium lacusfryxellense]